MPVRLSFRLSAVVVVVLLLLTACSAGGSGSGSGSGSGTKSAPPGPPMSAEIPPNLTDTWLAEALLPQFWGRRANEGYVAPAVERVADKPGPQAAFFGTPEVKGASCKRWAGGLRHAARDLARLDGKARIGGASYGGTYQGKPFVMGAALMVARPPLLDAMAKDPLAGCRKAQARVSMGFSVGIGGGDAKQTDFRWVEYVAEPLPDAAPLGDWSAAYRLKGEDDTWTWVKEVRFGPYLLQVSLVGRIPLIGGPNQPEHINVAKLDEAAATAYDHARKVLAGPSPVPTTNYPPPEPVPTETPLPSRSALRLALLTEFKGARRAAPVPTPLITVRGLRPGRAEPDRRWLESFGYVDPDDIWCGPYARTLWYAATDSEFFKDMRRVIALTSLRGPGRLYVTETILQSDEFILRSVQKPVRWCEGFTATVHGRKEVFTVRVLKDSDDYRSLEITQKGAADTPTYVNWQRFGDQLIEVRVGTVGVARNPVVGPEMLESAAGTARVRAQRYLR